MGFKKSPKLYIVHNFW